MKVAILLSSKLLEPHRTDGPLITAAQRDLPQLDEKLYLQLFAPPEAAAHRAAGTR